LAAVIVDHVDGPVGAHLQGLADRVDGLLRIDAQRGDRDLLVGALLAELQRLLDGVFVELGQQAVHADAIDGVVRLELPIASGVRHVLHTDDNVHDAWPRGPSSDRDSRRARGSCASGDVRYEARGRHPAQTFRRRCNSGTFG
jgi:hypothetical protein